MHAVDWALGVNAASGVLMIALGLFVAAVGSGSPANRAFALFAVPFGLAWIVDNLWASADHDAAFHWSAVGVLLILAALGLVALARVYPRPLAPHERGRVALAAAVAAGSVLVNFLAFSMLLGGTPTALQWDVVARAGFWTFHATVWGVLALFALRHRHLAQQAPAEASGLRTMSAALVLYPAFWAAQQTVGILHFAGWPPDSYLWGLASGMGAPVALAALWLRDALQSDRPSRGRALAWVTLAAALVGLPRLPEGLDHPGFGIARTVGVLLLAYAIVRHQLLGIDVKLRWGISKSTIAAVFIAVFFVVSEAAQQFFGDTIGSTYVGIAAAGALVFAIAPLQRAAERLAEKAVPIAGSAPAPSGKETAYRAALRVALRDRVLTPEEQIGLAHLSDELGLTHKRAREIWIEVEKERAADEAAG